MNYSTPPYLIYICAFFLLTVWGRAVYRFFIKKAELHIQIYGATRQSKNLKSMNVSGWYYFRNVENNQTKTCQLFVAFNRPFKKDQIEVEFDDMDPSRVEKEVKGCSALITFTGEVNIGTIIVRASAWPF